MSKVIAIIPARLGSTRLKEKMVQPLGGEPLIVRVSQNIQSSKLFDKVIIATDSEKIMEACQSSGIEAVMTSVDHTSGTDRVWEVAKSFSEDDIIVNVQGDEPFLSHSDLKSLVDTFKNNPEVEMVSQFESLKLKDLENPNVVKVILDSVDNAVYFSRFPIPYSRTDVVSDPVCKKHIGVYGFRYQALKKFCQAAPTVIENSEKLEQLRALYYGIKIKMVEAFSPSIGIDTEEDLVEANKKFKEIKNGKDS